MVNGSFELSSRLRSLSFLSSLSYVNMYGSFDLSFCLRNLSYVNMYGSFRLSFCLSFLSEVM